MTAIVCTYSLYHSCFLEVGQLLFYSIFSNANNFSQLFSASLRIFSQNIKNLLLGTTTSFLGTSLGTANNFLSTGLGTIIGFGGTSLGTVTSFLGTYLMFFSPDYYLKLFTTNVINNLDFRILSQYTHDSRSYTSIM